MELWAAPLVLRRRAVRMRMTDSDPFCLICDVLACRSPRHRGRARRALLDRHCKDSGLSIAPWARPPSRYRLMVRSVCSDIRSLCPPGDLPRLQSLALPPHCRRHRRRVCGYAYVSVLLTLVFFDDEHRNGASAPSLHPAEVQSKLGVHFVEVGTQGLDRATFQRGLEAWQKKRRTNAKST